MGNFPVTDDAIRALKIKVLRDLAASKHPRSDIGTIAARHELTYEDVKALVEKHGWPDPGAMGRAADVLEGKQKHLEHVRTAHPIATKSAVAAAPPPATSAPVSKIGPVQALSTLVAAGEKSKKARTRNLAAKIRGDMKTLQGLLDAERKEAEAKKAAEERAGRLLKEIAELERQVAEKRAELRSGKPSTSSMSSDERALHNKKVRAWAKENGVECSVRGLIAEDVLLAYQHAQAEGISA